MSIDDVLDVLLVGDDSSIKALEGTGVRYKFSTNTCGIRVRCGNDMVSAYKVCFTPACVVLFGNEHVF